MDFERLTGKIFKITLVLLVWVGTCLPAFSKPSCEDILKKTSSINKNLESFKVVLKIKTKFMGLAIPFYGKLFFKKPDRFRLLIPMLPAALRGKKGIFEEAVPRSFNPDDYQGEIIGTEKLEGEVECYIIELVPVNSSKIKKAFLWIDKRSFLAPKSKIFYSSGSSVVTLQSFRKVKDFVLPDKQLIYFEFPGFAAESLIEYKKYYVNVNVDDMLKKEKD